MDLEPTTPLTSFGATDAQGWSDDLNEWKFNGSNTRSTQKALAERLAHAARVCAGYEKPYAEKLQDDQNKELFDNSVRWAEANQANTLIQQAPLAVQGDPAPTRMQYSPNLLLTNNTRIPPTRRMLPYAVHFNRMHAPKPPAWSSSSMRSVPDD